MAEKNSVRIRMHSLTYTNIAYVYSIINTIIFTELFSLGLECFGEEYSWYALPREWLLLAPRGLISTFEPEMLKIHIREKVLVLIRIQIQTDGPVTNLNCGLAVDGMVTNDVSLLELIILRKAFALRFHRLHKYSGRGVKLSAPPISLGVADVCKYDEREGESYATLQGPHGLSYS